MIILTKQSSFITLLCLSLIKLVFFTSIVFGINEFASNHEILCDAIQTGNINLLKAALKSGFKTGNPILENGVKKFPLHIAIRAGKPRVAKWLLDNGADVNARNDEHREIDNRLSALALAIINKNEELVKLLVGRGASVKQPLANGMSLLQAAVKMGVVGIVDVLLKNGACADIDNYPPKQQSPLMIASCKGLSDIVKLLLKNGASIDLKDTNGATALFKAIANNHIQVAEILLKHGAAINIYNKHGVSPLMLAVSKKDTPMIDVLLVHKAAIDGSNDKGETTLKRALIAKNYEMAKVLLIKGAGISKDKEAVSELSFVIRDSDDAELISLLLDKGIDVNDKINLGFKLSQAKDSEINFTTTKATPLFLAVRLNKFEITKALLARGAKVNDDATYKDIPLFVLALVSKADKSLMKLLIKFGANINKRSSGGRPLTIAAIS